MFPRLLTFVLTFFVTVIATWSNTIGVAAAPSDDTYLGEPRFVDKGRRDAADSVGADVGTPA